MEADVNEREDEEQGGGGGRRRGRGGSAVLRGSKKEEKRVTEREVRRGRKRPAAREGQGQVKVKEEEEEEEEQVGQRVKKEKNENDTGGGEGRKRRDTRQHASDADRVHYTLRGLRKKKAAATKERREAAAHDGRDEVNKEEEDKEEDEWEAVAFVRVSNELNQLLRSGSKDGKFYVPTDLVEPGPSSPSLQKAKGIGTGDEKRKQRELFRYVPNDSNLEERIFSGVITEKAPHRVIRGAMCAKPHCVPGMPPPNLQILRGEVSTKWIIGNSLDAVCNRYDEENQRKREKTTIKLEHSKMTTLEDFLGGRSDVMTRDRNLTEYGLDYLVHAIIKKYHEKGRSFNTIDAIAKHVHDITHAANPQARSFGINVLSKVLHRVADWVPPGKWAAKPTFAANASAPARAHGDAGTSTDKKNARTSDDGNAKDVQSDAVLVDGGGGASAVRAPALKDFLCLKLYEIIGVTEEEFEAFEQQYSYGINFAIVTDEAYDAAFAYFSKTLIVQLNLNAWIDIASREVKALPMNGHRKGSAHDHASVFKAILNQHGLFTRARVLLHKMTRELEGLHERMGEYRAIKRMRMGSVGTTDQE